MKPLEQLWCLLYSTGIFHHHRKVAHSHWGRLLWISVTCSHRDQLVSGHSPQQWARRCHENGLSEVSSVALKHSPVASLSSWQSEHSLLSPRAKGPLLALCYLRFSPHHVVVSLFISQFLPLDCELPEDRDTLYI